MTFMLTMRPTLLIPAVLLAVIPIIAATPSPQATGAGVGDKPVTPAIVQKFDKWNYVGCFPDDSNARTLTKQITVIPNKVQYCLEACKNGKFAFAGLEFGEQCWCGGPIPDGRTMVDPAYCDYPCPGNNSQICGGENHLTMYMYTGVYPPSR